MLFCYIFLAVSLMNFLHDFHVSSCDSNCEDKPVFTPSRLVVKHGDPTSASCSVCHACNSSLFGLEKSVGRTVTNGTTISWTVDGMDQWGTAAICYYDDELNQQCCSTLPVTVYKPPDNVSISFVDHTGPMIEGHQYTLQCTVQNVAPVENLIVTFYRGQTALDQLKTNSTYQKPLTETFTFNITPSKEHDGVQYWCEAKLELGPEGPQIPPAVKSQNILATVHYKPQILRSSPSDPVIVTAGYPLELDCSAVGKPSPSYIWIHPSGIQNFSSSSVLTINSTTSVDKGQYKCSVSNAVGSATVSFTVDVQVNWIGYIIAGIVAVLVLVIVVVGLIYFFHYKNSKTGNYDVLPSVCHCCPQHSAVLTVEGGQSEAVALS